MTIADRIIDITNNAREDRDEVSEVNKIIKVLSEIHEHNEEIKDIKADTKEMIELFCEQNPDYTPKQIRSGYKYFKKFVKDRQQLTEEELEREKIIELIEQI